MTIYFIGGFFPEGGINDINKKSRGVIQYAAHAFQENLVRGISGFKGRDLKIINMPFVGSYPLRYADHYVRGARSRDIFNSSIITEVGFLNYFVAKYFARFFSLLFFLLKNNINKESKIIVYSLHTPFLAATWLATKIKRRKIQFFVIIPDLPEFMSDSKNIFYLLFKKIDGFFSKFFLGKSDGCILLTEGMADYLRLLPNEYIVVEGVSRPDVGAEVSRNSVNRNVILYTGTLARRYGVCELVDAFNELKDDNVELWICGDGDAKAAIVSAAEKNPKIKFFGQIPIESVRVMQREARILINPRAPEGEYTKYSFPSKIIEYMASGRPLIMHRLDGIPSDYYNYCFSPKNVDVHSLAECISEVTRLSDLELDHVGLLAKEFIMANKTSRCQAEKIVKFIEKI